MSLIGGGGCPGDRSRHAYSWREQWQRLPLLRPITLDLLTDERRHPTCLFCVLQFAQAAPPALVLCRGCHSPSTPGPFVTLCLLYNCWHQPRCLSPWLGVKATLREDVPRPHLMQGYHRERNEFDNSVPPCILLRESFQKVAHNGIVAPPCLSGLMYVNFSTDPLLM